MSEQPLKSEGFHPVAEITAIVDQANSRNLSASQRAMVAAKILDVSESLLTSAREKRQQAIRDLRNGTPDTGPQQDCFVCDRFQLITHLHHVCPVAEYVGTILPHEQQTVWLCPNCHAIIHRFRASTDIWGLEEYLTPEQWRRIGILIEMEQKTASGRGQ